ncbi:adenylosuccinate lyase [Candidatus Peregrinibacteria bacterium HGW-Peregrinibacteria-1]|jgi:adenylosuccinate lyase|nr:MAG: adenylosuccinate lyase [Candidatus Peregrinibacteria bacterium HGW-Peregrinibacteria-1]
MLFNISPLDGRYKERLNSLSNYFSEAALMKYRVLIEIEWLIYLFNDLQLKGTKKFIPQDLRLLRQIYEKFDEKSATEVKTIEGETNHDVKAIEYFIKEKIKGTEIEEYDEFVHFGCTSEDINNLAYALMVKDFTSMEYLPTLKTILQELFDLAQSNKDVPMISRTHGQPASPTTLGKEVINFVSRIENQLKNFEMKNVFMGKMNGAVGNFNAHLIAYPEIDWSKATNIFVQAMGLKANSYTTQIEPHDSQAELYHLFIRINNILLDLSRDFWTYISLGYFNQKTNKGEIGSSTMPHKINPIDFENAEGNIGISNALFQHLANKLPISRLQRDLSDSTAQRNIGSACAHTILSFKSILKGINKLEVNHDKISQDLQDHWELLAEPIQTVMRKNHIPKAYEKLKDLTRGEKIDQEAVQTFIETLSIPNEDKEQLLSLTPEKYIGMASKLVSDYKLKYSSGEQGCGPKGCGTCNGCG